VAVLPKDEFKRLVTGLTDDQYLRVLEALARADVDLPGWRDRSLVSEDQLCASDPVSVHVPFVAWYRALELARRVATTERGVWIVTDADSVRVVGADNRAAACSSITATVSVPGIALVDGVEAFLVTDALAKGMTAAVRRSASITLHAEDNLHLRLSVNGRSHRARLHRRGEESPSMPPVAEDEVVVGDAAALRRAIFHVCPASDSRGSDDVLRLDRVGMRAVDGVLTIDATDRYRAAEANLPVSHEHAFEAFVDATWLREVSDALTHGHVQIGISQEHGTSLLMIAGDRWSAWTTAVGAWRRRYHPKLAAQRVSATVARNDLQRFLRDAHRLATAGSRGPSDGCVRATVEPGTLRISGMNDDDESANIGSVRLPADTAGLTRTTVVYLDIKRTIDALRSFANEVVTVHLDDDRMVHVTPSESTPDGQPALMWSMVGSLPPDERDI